MSDQVHGSVGYSPNDFTYQPVKPSEQRHSRWWQFNLKTMLITVTAIAVFFGFVVAPGIPAIILTAGYVVSTIGLVIAAFYGKGWIRPYSICGLVPMAGFALMTLVDFPFRGPEQLVIGLIILFVITNLVGLTGAVTHGFLSRRSGFVPVPNIPFLRDWLSND
jgi:hypothetical protein